MKMSKKGAMGEKPILIQRLCYYTSLEHLTSKEAKHGNIYEHKGKAVVTDSNIYYRSDDVNFDIPITSIVEMRIGTFYRYDESSQLNYLALTFAVSGNQKTVLFVPTESTLTPQWKTNKIIENWYNTITQLKARTYKEPEKEISTEKTEIDTDKQSIVSSEDKDDYWDFKPSPPPEKFSLSKIPPHLQVLYSITLFILIVITAVFWELHGELGLLVGFILMIIVIVPMYSYLYIQFQVRLYIRDNKEKNILFKMWTELEEEPFLGPFKTNK
jgi:hypothetical protein